MVKWLLAKGADVNSTDKIYWTPLHYALGSTEVTEKLRPKQKPDRTLEIVKILVEAKADVNADDDHGVTPIFLALDDREILRYLDRHGGSTPGGSAYRGKNTLHWAVINESPLETIEFILKKGAPVNAFDGDGNAPLHYAVQRKDLKIVKLLVEHGADINLARDIDERETPLDLALSENQTEIVKYLKSKGAVRGKSSSGKAAP